MIPPVVDDEPAVKILVAKEVSTNPIGRRSETTGGQCLFVSTNGDMDFFEIDQGTPKKISPVQLADACVKFASAFKFYYHSATSYSKGMKWIIPETSRYCMTLPCEIIGFAKVAGTDTVKVLAERHLDNRELQHYIAYEKQQVKEMEIQQHRSGDAVDKVMKDLLRRTIEEARTKSIQIITYVDLQTGITVRQESTTTLHKHKPTPIVLTNLTVFQTLRS